MKQSKDNQDAIGIDTGSYKSVLACVKAKGIEIVLSESSGKSTPTIVAYTDQERLIGDSAANQMKKNFKNSLQFFQRFLGLNSDCKQQLDEENRYITYKTSIIENKKVGIEVTCRGEKIVLTPEQVMAGFLVKAKKYFENNGLMGNEMVISVPSYATNSERQAYLDAAEIAGIKCIRLINESTAIALTYGFFRKAELDPVKPRIVAFVDFGHSKVTITYCSFIPGKTKIIMSHSNRNLGARKIDFLLFDQFSQEFLKKYGCDPRDNLRARLRLLDGIEKMRKLLSGNKEAEINCESLMEDEDFRKLFKREELETLMDPFMREFTLCLKESLAKSGLSCDHIDSVELVGEATRIPIVQEQIKMIFNKKELSRTLNSQDCIARGCALQAAMLSPNFSVANFEIEEYNPLPICISYKFKGSEKVVTKELFKTGSSFPASKSITFDNKLGGTDLLVHYSDKVPMMSGLPNQIAQFEISEGKIEHKDPDRLQFTMRITNNIHNIAVLDCAEVSYEYLAEEHVPYGPTDKKGCRKFNVEKKQKKQETTLPYKSSSYALAPNVRKQYLKIEQEINAGDHQILDLKEVKNNLEAYSYDMRSKIDSYGDLEKYVDAQQKADFLKQINDVVEWLYDDASKNATKEELADRFAHFKAIGDPIKQRHYYYSEVDIYIQQFQKFGTTLQAQFDKYPFLSDQQRDQILKIHGDTQEFFNQVEQDRKSKTLTQDPNYTIDQINFTLNNLKGQTDQIFKKVPQKPVV